MKWARSKLPSPQIQAAVSVGVGMCAFWFLAASTALHRAREFAQPLGLDNAYFLQRTWQAAFLDSPQRTLLATETGEGVIAGRHFEPILSLLVPLVRAAPSMETLLLAQVGLLGLGGVGAYRISRSLGLDRLVSVLLSWTWLALPGVWAMGTLDFRTFALAAPLVVCALAALLEHRLFLGTVLLLLAAGCREEVAALCLLTAPALAWTGRADRRFAPAFVVLGVGLGWSLLVMSLHSEQWNFIQPDEFLAQTIGAPSNADTWHLAKRLHAHLGMGSWLVILSPLESLGVLANWMSAAAMQALLNENATHVFAVAIALMALVHAAALARIGRFLTERQLHWSDTATRALAALLLVSSLSNNPQIGLSTQAAEPECWSVIHQVPPVGAVLTQSRFAAALATRPEIYVTEDWREPDRISGMLERVEWVLLQDNHSWLDQLESQAFTRQQSGGGVVLLKAPDRLILPGYLTPH